MFFILLNANSIYLTKGDALATIEMPQLFFLLVMVYITSERKDLIIVAVYSGKVE